MLIGEGLEKATGTNDRSFGDIVKDTAVNTVTATAFSVGLKMVAKPLSKVFSNVVNEFD